jgi:hypothetical protein
MVKLFLSAENLLVLEAQYSSKPNQLLEFFDSPSCTELVKINRQITSWKEKLSKVTEPTYKLIYGMQSYKEEKEALSELDSLKRGKFQLITDSRRKHGYSRALNFFEIRSGAYLQLIREYCDSSLNRSQIRETLDRDSIKFFKMDIESLIKTLEYRGIRTMVNVSDFPEVFLNAINKPFTNAEDHALYFHLRARRNQRDGMCAECGRTLTHEYSVGLGLGPICGNHYYKDISNDSEPLTERQRSFVRIAEYYGEVSFIRAQIRWPSMQWPMVVPGMNTNWWHTLHLMGLANEFRKK